MNSKNVEGQGIDQAEESQEKSNKQTVKGFNWPEYLNQGMAEIKKLLTAGDNVNARRLRVNLEKARYWAERLE